jgi:hypothetical protein
LNKVQREEKKSENSPFFYFDADPKQTFFTFGSDKVVRTQLRGLARLPLCCNNFNKTPDETDLNNQESIGVSIPAYGCLKSLEKIRKPKVSNFCQIFVISDINHKLCMDLKICRKYIG